MDAEHAQNVPAELRALPQWVLWKMVPREDKVTKEPRRVDSPGSNASSTNPATWATFDAAVAALPGSDCDGIGFVFTEDDPFCGIDIDKARTSSGLHPAALDLIERLGSYTEWSPSKKGTHTIVRARCTAPNKIDAEWAEEGIERYSTGRYFTVTGMRFPHLPATVNDAQEVVDSLPPPDEHATPAQPVEAVTTPPDLQDHEVLEKARASKKGAQFTALYDRGDLSDYGNNHSRADLALCNYLAFWTGKRPEQMDRLFRGSKLMRAKWYRNARAGETYGEGTIRKAIATTTESYTPTVAATPPPPPLPEGMTGTEVLDAVAAFIEEYVVLPSDEALHTVVLFLAHTHGVEAADTTPYLHIRSPEKRAGKTVLMDVITPLVGHPLAAVSASAAAIYRGIVEEGVRRTLLLDEVDAVFSAKGSEQAEALRQVLNAGTRRGATVIRCNGNTGKNEEFDPFGPKVLGGIAEVPDTLADRCICISMDRATPEQLKGLKSARYRSIQAGAKPLHQQLAAWVATVMDQAAEIRPEPVDGLSSRSMDAWEPLLALAEMAGGKWPQRAKDAAAALSTDNPEAVAQDTMYRRLVVACDEVFAKDEFLPSEELVDRLKAHDDEWLWLNSTGITTRRLAAMLGRYNVEPKRQTYARIRQRGYTRKDIQRARTVWIDGGTDQDG